MKNTIISALILILIVTFLILDSAFIANIMRSISYELSCMSDSPSEELEQACRLTEIWSSHELAVTMTVPRSKSDAARNAIEMVSAYAKTDDIAAFIAAKRTALLALESIRDSAIFSFDTIF